MIVTTGNDVQGRSVHKYLYDTTEFSEGVTEVLAYGTAVTLG